MSGLFTDRPNDKRFKLVAASFIDPVNQKAEFDAWKASGEKAAKEVNEFDASVIIYYDLMRRGGKKGQLNEETKVNK